MDIRIAGTEYSLHNKSFEIYIQGCTRHCPGCHNPETQPLNGGEVVDIDQWLSKQAQKVYKFNDLVDRIFISGGDLLCLPYKEAQHFTHTLCRVFADKPIWLFTGAREEDVEPWVFNFYDVVKCGEYDQTQKQDGFPASKNQKLIINKQTMFHIDTLDFKGEIKWK